MSLSTNAHQTAIAGMYLRHDFGYSTDKDEQEDNHKTTEALQGAEGKSLVITEDSASRCWLSVESCD